MADPASIKKFSELTKLTYAEQAKWFLNGFWAEGMEPEAEKVWQFVEKFVSIDEKKKNGNELNEFQAHKFLESVGETLTVVEMRERLRKIDLDFNKRVALIEYLTVRYEKNVQQVVDAKQGDNSEQVKEASNMLSAVQKALEEVQSQLAQQTLALEAQKQSAADALAAVEEQKKAEESVRKAESEQRAAVDELKSQEDSYHNQIKVLETKSQDATASTVSKNKAAAELAQLKQEDPLPLRKAKISQEATLRKVEKERKAAEAATANAEAKARDAEDKKAQLEEQTRKVEDAVKETEQKVQEAEAYLADVKTKGGVPNGSIWWMEKEIAEAQKYLPKKKQQKL